MPRTPRLTDADRADLATRHKVVTARVIASEEIARKLLWEPVDDATRHLVARVAGEHVAEGTIKRAVFGGVRAVSESLASGAQSAVGMARNHARALATSQVTSDLASFATQAHSQGLRAVAPTVRRFAVATVEQEGAIANQAGLAVAHRWSSQMLGSYVQWKRSGGGVDGLIRSFQAAGSGGLESLVESQAVTQAVDAYADQHALTWKEIADELAAQDAANATGANWSNGLFDVWSAILDRRTCPRCLELDGTLVPVGTEYPDAGRPPLHVRCRCEPVALYVPEAAAKNLPGVELDYAALKADVADYMKGATLDIGEGRRHAQAFMGEALASHSPTVLAGRLSDRRGYFPNRPRSRAPRLVF